MEYARRTKNKNETNKTFKYMVKTYVSILEML